MKHRTGFVIMYVLFALVLTAVILATLSSRSFFRTQASRATLARSIAESAAESTAQEVARVIYGPLTNIVREEVSHVASTGDYYFGSDSAASVATDMQALANRLQARANDLFCDYTPASGADEENEIKVRVFFTSTACGDPLPSYLSLSPPRRTQGRAGAFQEYALPFVVLVTSDTGEFQGEKAYTGEYRFGMGADSFARYALFVNNNYAPDGNPGYLRSFNIIEGPVHTNGILNVWGTPYVTGVTSTASCPNLDIAGGCLEEPRPSLGLHAEGVVPAGSLTPNPAAPCYPGGDCPVFAGGVDYAATFVDVPDETENAPLDAAQDAGVFIGEGATQVRLEVGSVPENGRTVQAQIIDLETASRQIRLYSKVGADADGAIWLIATPGNNLVLNHNFALENGAGWLDLGYLQPMPASAPEVPAGAPSPYVMRTGQRDAYYGNFFKVQAGQRFDLSVAAASGTATGVPPSGGYDYSLQIGFQFHMSDGTYSWKGTRSQGIVVSNNGTWQVAQARITVPAGAKEARVWVQINQPNSSHYTYYFTNASVAPAGHTEYVKVADDFNGVIYLAGDINDLAGPGPGHAISAGSQLTLAAEGTVRITDSIYLEEPPCSQGPGYSGSQIVPSVCENTTATDVLGIYSHNGNILIAQSAPSTVHVEAALMARNGWIGAEGYDTRDPQVSVFVLGSIVEDRYGQFGSFTATGELTHGYKPVFVYDPRFSASGGLYPPGWPEHEGDLLYVVASPLAEMR